MAEPYVVEVKVWMDMPMPSGYCFVPNGNAYITNNCRRRTHEAGATLYVLLKKKRALGIRCPQSIRDVVVAEWKAGSQEGIAETPTVTTLYDFQIADTTDLLPGYCFVPSDDVLIKDYIRRTHESGLTLYHIATAGKKSRPLGLRCPKIIYDTVVAEAKAGASNSSTLAGQEKTTNITVATQPPARPAASLPIRQKEKPETASAAKPDEPQVVPAARTRIPREEPKPKPPTMAEEIQVRPFAAMPAGYRFVPKGDPYITRNCRVRTHEARKQLYIVVNDKKTKLGLRCPKHIYQAVLAESKATANKRAEAVKKRDNAMYDKFEEALLQMFPKCPKDKIPQILKHALQKRSGRVGRTSTVDLEEKVKLAVRAHIRHCHTPYDALLKESGSRQRARDEVLQRVNEVAIQWGHVEKFKRGKKRKLEGAQGRSPRKVVPIPGKKGAIAKRLVASTSQASVGGGSHVTTRQIGTGAGTVEEPFEILDSDVDIFSMSEDDTSDWSEWNYSGDEDED